MEDAVCGSEEAACGKVEAGAGECPGRTGVCRDAQDAGATGEAGVASRKEVLWS